MEGGTEKKLLQSNSTGWLDTAASTLERQRSFDSNAVFRSYTYRDKSRNNSWTVAPFSPCYLPVSDSRQLSFMAARNQTLRQDIQSILLDWRSKKRSSHPHKDKHTATTTPKREREREKKMKTSKKKNKNPGWEG